MIEIVEVTKKIDGVTALNNISLQVAQGEILGIVGPDGAGKTTLLRLLTGVMKEFNGSITILGTNDIETVKGHFGYVPQRFSLYSDMTVLENINLVGALYGVEATVIAKTAQKILKATGLWEFKDRLAGNLSGGMKQKLALAAGVMHKPKIFFLDEPTTGVDPVARREFWQLLYELNQEGMTIIVATPYMEEAELCHRVAMLDRGELICCKTPDELIADYPNALLELQTEKKSLQKFLQDCYCLEIHSFGDVYHLATDNVEKTINDIKNRFEENNLSVPKHRLIKPSLEDVFIIFSK